MNTGKAAVKTGKALVGAALTQVQQCRQQAQQAIDPNKLRHIFGNAQHNLGNLVTEFGSEEKAFRALQAATDAVVKQKGINGVFEQVVQVGTQQVTVRGNVVNGVVKIGTAFK